LKAILEVDRDAYYAGDAIPIRVFVWNDGEAAADGPPGTIEGGFELFDVDGKKIALPVALDPAPSAAVPEASPASALRPGGFVGFAGDLTKLFPRLKEIGTYRLQWRSGSLASNTVILRVVPRYDPETNYSARVETDLGSFTIEFLRRQSPLAVKTFVELAMQGFYDGLLFHYVEPGRIALSGDPTGTGEGGPGFVYPRELAPLKMVAGTVFMKPVGEPPANGSIFAILLSARPEYEGRYTAFAQVVEGLEVAKKLSEVPASARSASPAHRPLQEVRIRRITVTPKPAV
jgi:cyclophilin family peptidyl-prolyl cis-trans isomerase